MHCFAPFRFALLRLRLPSLCCALLRVASLLFAALCLATLGFALLCCPSLRFALLRFAWPRVASLRFASLCFALVCFALLCHTLLRSALLRITLFRFFSTAKGTLSHYSSARPQTVFQTNLFSSVFKPGRVILTMPQMWLILLLSWYCIASK